jgi:cbb3-type cytochrome oxidase subunit 3
VKAVHLPAVGLTFAALDFILIITTQFYVFGFLIATVMIIASLAYLVYLYRAHQKEQQVKSDHLSLSAINNTGLDLNT